MNFGELATWPPLFIVSRTEEGARGRGSEAADPPASSPPTLAHTGNRGAAPAFIRETLFVLGCLPGLEQRTLFFFFF